jgi:hypothetical protein
LPVCTQDSGSNSSSEQQAAGMLRGERPAKVRSGGIYSTPSPIVEAQANFPPCLCPSTLFFFPPVAVGPARCKRVGLTSPPSASYPILVRLAAAAYVLTMFLLQ